MASSDGLTITFFVVEASMGSVAATFLATAFLALAGAAFFTAGLVGAAASGAVDLVVLVEVFLAAMLEEV